MILQKYTHADNISRRKIHTGALAGWIYGLCIPLLALPFAVKQYWSKQSIIELFIASILVSLFATMAFGFYLARKRLWKAYFWRNVITGSIGVLICYAVAMIVSNPNDPLAENEAGAGITFLAIPAAVLIALALAIGAGFGRLTLPTAVFAPDGKQWFVWMQLIPDRQGIGLRERFARRRSANKRKAKKSDWFDFFFNIPYPDSLDDIWFLIGFVILVILFIFIGWPLLLLLADFIWLLLVILGAFISFIVLQRPVTIIAACDGQRHTWKARGYLEARKQMKEISGDIEKGDMVNGIK